MKIFKSLVQDPDLEFELMAALFKADQHSAGAAGQEPQAIGRTRGGNTTKIHMAVDGFGSPIEFEITGGEINDC